MLVLQPIELQELLVSHSYFTIHVQYIQQLHQLNHRQMQSTSIKLNKLNGLYPFIAAQKYEPS